MLYPRAEQIDVVAIKARGVEGEEKKKKNTHVSDVVGIHMANLNK